MRRSDDQSSRPRRGRRLTAAALAVGLAGAAATSTGVGPGLAASNPLAHRVAPCRR